MISRFVTLELIIGFYQDSADALHIDTYSSLFYALPSAGVALDMIQEAEQDQPHGSIGMKLLPSAAKHAAIFSVGYVLGYHACRYSMA